MTTVGLIIFLFWAPLMLIMLAVALAAAFREDIGDFWPWEGKGKK